MHTATGNPHADAEVAARCEDLRILCINAGDGAHGTARLAAETRSGDSIVGVVSDAGVDPGRTSLLRDAIGERLREGGLPVRRRRPSAVGRVHLVGGGPGPVDLITVRGRRLIAEADVVVVDRLGATAVLDELAPDVEVIDVGKRPGHHPVPQSEINAIIVDRAKRGLQVVRLKGGDPFVYGRGGEEVLACHEAGVPVEVVPGISSIVAVPEAAGIPVTHRGTAAAMHVVNGQDAPTDATLAALRDPQTTTVVLMGVSALTVVRRRSARRRRRPAAAGRDRRERPHRRAAHHAVHALRGRRGCCRRRGAQPRGHGVRCGCACRPAAAFAILSATAAGEPGP